ncbi:SulP family inorganic anion transporter [Gulosibacter sp. 10]|uniref:SulP family inorganic anion transporter n=1 Tax=Gulosibacter sp. 10 TaxID=1255570 RepID=UPI000B35239A|nr:SulP family inorganic anion transporter [Gulosibacter sp. 10]
MSASSEGRRGIARTLGDRLLPRASDYRPFARHWRVDITAGITVAIVALPLALAFGISSGVSAAAGLVTAVVAGLVAAVFGGSNVQVSGPTGAMAVVLAPVVAVHGAGSVPLLALMAGILLLFMGLLGLGRVVSLIPWTVVEGFTLGIGIIIFLQQVPMAFGTTATIGMNPVLAAGESIGRADWSVAWQTLLVVAVTWALILVLPRVHRAIPASLIAVAAATALVVLVDMPVPRIGELPTALPAPSIPAFDLGSLSALIAPAISIALLAAIESLLSARVASRMADTGHYNPDRELSGQGLASIASGLFGGMPATGAIARTAVNVRSGARSRASAIVHALILLVVIYLGAALVSEIPLAALAGVLMATAIRMVSPLTIKAVMRATRADALIFFATAGITVAFDLIVAVEIGLVATAIFALKHLADQAGVRREELPGDRVEGDERIALVRIDGAMFFGAAERLRRQFEDLTGIEVVIIRLSHLSGLDATGANALVEIIETFEQRGVTVLIKGLHPRYQQVAKALGVYDALRDERHVRASLEDAVDHARSHIRRGPWRAPGGGREPEPAD